MGIVERVRSLIVKAFFNAKWKCLLCGEEIFDESKNFCEKCEMILPFNDGAICAHCGRKVIASEPYCSTCKGTLVSLDLCRSCFNYEKPISKLIKDLKYNNRRYLVDYFGERLSLLYLKNYFNADAFVYVPMTKKAFRKRGYNQSELLARKVSQRTSVPVLECLEKVAETKRQATLTRAERLKNLDSAFRVTDKKSVKNKTLVIVDDVSTTGATAQAIASRLKRAGAERVYLITVASTPPIEKY